MSHYGCYIFFIVRKKPSAEELIVERLMFGTQINKPQKL